MSQFPFFTELGKKDRSRTMKLFCIYSFKVVMRKKISARGKLFSIHTITKANGGGPRLWA